MKSDRANVCTLASALINSQPLSALPRLHFKIPNRVSALPRLHLKIANQSGCLHFRVWKNPDYRLEHPSNAPELLRDSKISLLVTRQCVCLMMNLHCPTQGPFSICTLSSFYSLFSQQKCCATIAFFQFQVPPTYSLYCEKHFHDVESTIFVK